MCSIRCPIKVTVKDGQVTFIEGNPKVAGIDGSLCPRGSAGISLLYDSQRLQSPMIRTGERGSGQWRKATWDEALDYHRGQAQAHHQKARRPERGPDRADQSVHPCEQDVSQSHRLAQPLHPRRLVQGLGQHGLPLAFRVHRRPDGDRLQEHQAHRHVRPQPVRGHRGQGGEQPHGRHGGGRQGDLHRPARFHHRHQSPPLLDDPARHGPGTELRPHARDPQGAALRRRVRGEVGAGTFRAAGFRAALHAGMGRKGDRHPGRRDRGPGARDEQGQAVGHLPLRLPRGPSRQRDLPAPVHPDPERPHGQHRGQGRHLLQEGARRGRRQAGAQADRAEVPGHQGAPGRQGRHQGFSAAGPRPRGAADAAAGHPQ